MDKLMSAYQLACKIHADHDVPVFPVRLSRAESGKWHKQPLVQWSKVSGNPDDEVWRGANAIGVPMGSRSGLIAVDLDTYKEGNEVDAWMQRHDLPATRAHLTASGGQHLIYRLPEGINLYNNAPPVTGLDIRGSGGFIVWGDIDGHYSVLDDRMPAQLPDTVCSELLALRTSRKELINGAATPAYRPVSEADLEKKLDELLRHPKGALVQDRFKGSVKDLRDKSASGRDMSVAALLAQHDFSFHEIVQTLLTRFPHGVAARDGWDDLTERLAKRCAFRATEQRRLRSEQRKQAMEENLAERRAKYSRLLVGKEGNAQ